MVDNVFKDLRAVMSLCPLCHVLPAVIKLHFLTDGTGGGSVPTLRRGTSTDLVKKWIPIGALKKPHHHKVSQWDTESSMCGVIYCKAFSNCVYELSHRVPEAPDRRLSNETQN